jgi:predicted phosphoadenosine phosphosulfate sulfurtransferase
MKRHLGIDVLQAARDRVRYAFDHFEAIYVSFSAGNKGYTVQNIRKFVSTFAESK